MKLFQSLCKGDHFEDFGLDSRPVRPVAEACTGVVNEPEFPHAES